MPINEVEKKLAQYRAKKERETLINHYKAQVKTVLSKIMYKKVDKSEEESQDRECKAAVLKQDTSIKAQDTESNSEVESNNEEFFEPVQENTSFTLYDYIYYTLWFLLWATVYTIFIKLQFGTIYLIVSGIIGIYLNTRTGPKKKSEVSAYSVFNKNCESIDGTLNADQLTKEILYGGFR